MENEITHRPNLTEKTGDWTHEWYAGGTRVACWSWRYRCGSTSLVNSILEMRDMSDGRRKEIDLTSKPSIEAARSYLDKFIPVQ